MKQDDGLPELYDDVPSFQDRATVMVFNPNELNDDVEHAEMDMKGMCDTMFDDDGGNGDMMEFVLHKTRVSFYSHLKMSRVDQFAGGMLSIKKIA